MQRQAKTKDSKYIFMCVYIYIKTETKKTHYICCKAD